MELLFGNWYNVEIDGKEYNCQFIHYDSGTICTRCTVDIEGRWKHVPTSTVKPFKDLSSLST